MNVTKLLQIRNIYVSNSSVVLECAGVKQPCQSVSFFLSDYQLNLVETNTRMEQNEQIFIYTRTKSRKVIVFINLWYIGCGAEL